MTRATLVFTVFVVASTLIAGLLVFRAGREQIDAMAREDLGRALDLTGLRLSTFANTLDDDIGFLADNDPVNDLVRSLSVKDTLLARAAIDRVALLMGSFIRSRSLYAQVRLIEANDAGEELVRFDRDGATIRRTPTPELQSKGDRDYVQRTIVLGKGERYFSPVDLNREHGRISRPVMPTLRAGTPLRGDDGGLVGMVVINADLRPLFSELIASVGQRQQLVIARDDGQLILHPDTALTFRDEYGGSYKLADLLGTNEVPQEGTLEVGAHIWSLRTVRLHARMRPLTIAVSTDTRPFVTELRDRRNKAMLITVAIAGSFVLLSLVFARSIARRLMIITSQVERYAAGDATTGLPVHRKDEIGRLARGFWRMQERIDLRVKELEEARASAERADARRRELLANMSHEVRTPLNAILGMSDAIRPEGLGSADRERLSTVQRSAHRLKRLVDDLLLSARIVEGRLKVDLQRTDVRQVLQDVAQAHRPLAEEKGLALRLNPGNVRDGFITDPLRLHQILDNLVGNAVKYTEHGHVDIEAHEDKDRLIITVSDSGPGIAEDQRSRVFERFEQASRRAGDDPSAGLGLAITSRLLELLGGGIDLASTVGVGSRFTVRIPEGSGTGTVQRRSGMDKRIFQGLRVLYVEDVTTNRMLMEHWAGEGGWKLRLASNVAEAIEVTRKECFDLLLIDLDLGEDAKGTELAWRIRGLRKYRAVPMLAVTAYVDDDTADEALKAGLNDRITKPIDVDELAEQLAFWSGRSDVYCEETVNVNALSAQFDDDPERVLKALDQYRKEFLGARTAIRTASERNDRAAIDRERHKLRPHFKLLGMEQGIIALDHLAGGVGQDAPDLRPIMDAFRCCERAFLFHRAKLLFREGPDA
ncbi:MAG: response regulator [Flavobacteriales bacterium]|nr:response regulator [Flavobacteriales bacterium]MCB9167640.1 response regulator [Flavobacteriales bacterium]